MSEVVLNFKPENQKPPRKGAYYVSGIKLNPGRNKIPSEQFEKIKAVPNYQGLIDSQIIEVFKGKPPDEDKGTQEIKSLSGFPVREAEKLINGEKDLAILKMWQSNEAKTKERETVLNAIARQIQAVEGGNL